MQVTIDKFGRILIPKTIRNIMGLTPGRTVELVTNEKEQSLFLVPTNADVTFHLTDDNIPIFSFSEPAVIDFDIVELIKQDREDRAEKLWKGEQ